MCLPDPETLTTPPVVAFGFPGAGYSRGYYLFDMPGSSFGGQAGYHVTQHGWIFVACDHLGVGASSCPADRDLSLDDVATANRCTVEAVMGRLRDGSLTPGFPPIDDAIRVGIGQSMGGCLTVFLEGTTPTFDAVAVLGFSALHTTVPVPSGRRAGFEAESHEATDSGAREHALRYAFHSSDVPQDVVDADLTDYPTRLGRVPSWGSATMPGCVNLMPRPGVIAAQAAATEVPVFIGVGDIDVVPDPRAEPSAYKNATDITLFICPAMAHMHNFAGTRTVLWDRIGSWVDGLPSRRLLAMP